MISGGIHPPDSTSYLGCDWGDVTWWVTAIMWIAWFSCRFPRGFSRCRAHHTAGTAVVAPGYPAGVVSARPTRNLTLGPMGHDPRPPSLSATVAGGLVEPQILATATTEWVVNRGHRVCGDVGRVRLRGDLALDALGMALSTRASDALAGLSITLVAVCKPNSTSGSNAVVLNGFVRVRRGAQRHLQFDRCEQSRGSHCPPDPSSKPKRVTTSSTR